MTMKKILIAALAAAAFAFGGSTPAFAEEAPPPDVTIVDPAAADPAPATDTPPPSEDAQPDPVTPDVPTPAAPSAGENLVAEIQSQSGKPQGGDNEEKDSICHSGSGAHWSYIAPDDSGYNGHKNHELDIYGLTEAECLAKNPVEFVAYATSASWLLPASWPSSETPTYQAAIFPQDRTESAPPCDRWVQADNYWIENEADEAVWLSLGDVLTQGEDSAIYASHEFIYGGDCPPEGIPPAHKVDVQKDCGVWSATLSNEGATLTASYVAWVDGEFFGAYAVAGDATEIIGDTYPEDDGDHVVRIEKGAAQGGDVLAEFTVHTDCEPPADLVVTTEWKDGDFKCGDTTVDQTRESTDTPYIAGEDGWVLNTENAVTVTETQTRDLTSEEITVCPVVVPTPADPAAAILAFTGGQDLRPYFGAAGGLLMFGLIILVLERARRRAHISQD